MRTLEKFRILKNTRIYLGILSGFSVFYFLFFLDAFSIQKGISYSGHSHLFRSISFGFLTFVYQFILEVFIRNRFEIKSVQQNIIWFLVLVFIGSQLTFLLFNFFWNWQELSLRSYSLIQIEYPLMMIFPLGIYMLLHKVVDKPKPIQFLTFYSDNNKDLLKINLKDFLFAQSAENYITIYYLSSNGEKKHLIRKTLKSLESEISDYNEIKRVHRSYLVHTGNINQVVQKKDKIYLEIKSHSIPVSKSYRYLFLEE